MSVAISIGLLAAESRGDEIVLQGGIVSLIRWFVAAPSKRGEKKDFVPVQSLRNISESISRAAGDPVVRSMGAGQTLALLANIFRLEAEHSGER